MGAECGVLSCTQADDKAQNNDGLEQGIRALLDDFFFSCCISISPSITGCSQENRVRNVLSSLHFHFVDLCQQRTERIVIKENTHLYDKNIAYARF